MESNEKSKESKFSYKLILKFVIPVVLVLIIWIIPPPEGLELKAWLLFGIFLGTIIGIILEPIPMGAIAIIGITATTFFGVLPIKDSLSGFSNSTIWLIVLAFFISRGFIKTGLGSRIAYIFMRFLGKKTLGLGYGLIATDLVLAPTIPSNTARAGGVIYPILQSVSDSYGSNPKDGTSRKIGAFLTKASFQGTIITSAMFLTAMAANPLAVEFAEAAGVTISWLDWALAALVPGLISLILVPYIIYLIFPPEIKETPEASELASKKLTEMGRVNRNEWIMLATFVFILVCWILNDYLNDFLVDLLNSTAGTKFFTTTTTALLGLSLLLITGVLTWNDVLSEKGAWNTLIWFSALVMMAAQLTSLGFIGWVGDQVQNVVGDVDWTIGFLILALVYFYSHYFFASNTAHVSAMYAVFLAVAIIIGTPPMFAAIVLAFFSNLMSSMTHYGTGPAPILFGSGYVKLKEWWSIGLLISIINLVIWIVIGGIWWLVLGYW